MQIERKINITFRWWNEEETEISPKHIAILEESAQTRISDMMKEGYTSGVLVEEDIEGVGYQGAWEVKWEVI